MTHTKQNPIIHLLPSLTDVAFLMPVIFLFTKLEGVKFLLGDGDTGWHIRAGDWMLANGQVIRHDVFSFTKPGEPWYAWEWLWDVWFAWMHQHWGMEAVVLASILVLCFTSALLFRLVLRKCDNPFIAIGLTFLAVAASSIHWLARPHLFTMLFVVIFLSILDRVYTDHRRKLLYWLPVLTVLWTNLHGGFFMGIVFLGAFAAGELIDAALHRASELRNQALRRSVPYALAALGCLAASFVNPYTYQLHLHIIEYLSDPYHFTSIGEFQSINFHHSGAIYFEIILLAGVATAGWHATNRRFATVLLVVGTAHLALYSGRNIPIFAFVAAPALGAVLGALTTGHIAVGAARWAASLNVSCRQLAAEFAEMDRPWRTYFLSAAAVSVLALLVYRVPSPNLHARYDETRYPDGAIESIRQLGPSARILTDDEWGDYLIYRLYPNTKVFIDGRSDFYGERLGNEIGNILKVRYDWESKVRSFGVDTILLRANAPLSGALKQSTRWRVTHDDGIAIVFRVSPGMTVAPSKFAGSTANGNRDHAIASMDDSRGVRAATQTVVSGSRDQI